MEEKFERISISVQPEILEKLRKQAEKENLPLSRFLVNSASNASEKEYATFDDLVKILKIFEIRLDILLLQKKIGNADIGKKLHDFRKGKEWQSDVKRLDELKKIQMEEEAERFFGLDKPSRISDGFSILKGQSTIEQFRIEKEKKESQEIRKILESKK